MALALAMIRDVAPKIEDIESLVLDLINRGAAGSAVVSVNADLQGQARFQVEVKPKVFTAARIAVRITQNAVVLFFGEAAIFEVPFRGHRYTDLDCLGEVRKLCEGVIEGRFEEAVTRSNGVIIGGKGRIDVGEWVAYENWHKAWVNPFRKRENVTRKYDAYSTAD